ncbi:MAG TPA: DUF2076 domain-containing protein [Stellaceae bacterium]|nr:DUF2076 domain-containing protein [Stellaceae bacterium]
MVPQERDLITTLLARLKSFAGQPKDPEADALIRQDMVEQPDAPYYLVQTVLIQDLSLHQAQNRIAELEKQLSDAQATAKPATSFLGNFFGTGQPAGGSVPSAGPWVRTPQVAPAPPQQAYAQPQQGYAPAGGGMMGGGMMGGMGGGGGFLRSAAATAAGIAGGALLFQGISSLFGHGYANSLSGGMGMTSGLGETIINNNYGDSGAGGTDYGGGGDTGFAGGDSGGGTDYGGGGDMGGGDFGGGGDSGGGDFGGGGDSSSC